MTGIGIACIVVFVIVMACCTVSGRGTQQEEEHPCASCPRWDECNGVDEDCPLRK